MPRGFPDEVRHVHWRDGHTRLHGLRVRRAEHLVHRRVVHLLRSRPCATGGGTDPPVVVSGTTCADLSVLIDSFSWSAQASLPAASGTCTPGGGVATGGVATMASRRSSCSASGSEKRLSPLRDAGDPIST